MNWLHGLLVYFVFLSCDVVAFYFSVHLSFSKSNSFVRIRQLLSDFSLSAADFCIHLGIGYEQGCVVQW